MEHDEVMTSQQLYTATATGTKTWGSPTLWLPSHGATRPIDTLTIDSCSGDTVLNRISSAGTGANGGPEPAQASPLEGRSKIMGNLTIGRRQLLGGTAALATVLAASACGMSGSGDKPSRQASVNPSAKLEGSI